MRKRKRTRPFLCSPPRGSQRIITPAYEGPSAGRQTGADSTADRRQQTRTRLLRHQARPSGSASVGELRHQRAPGHVARRHVHRSPYPRHRPGRLRLSPGASHHRSTVPGQGHARALGGSGKDSVGSSRWQRRRGLSPGQQRFYAHPRPVVCGARVQSRAPGRLGGWNRHHTVPQPARRRRPQVQSAQRRPRRHQHYRLDSAPCQSTAPSRESRAGPDALRSGSTRCHNSPARLRQTLRGRTGIGTRSRRDPGRGREIGCRSAGRRLGRLLGADP